MNAHEPPLVAAVALLMTAGSSAATRLRTLLDNTTTSFDLVQVDQIAGSQAGQAAADIDATLLDWDGQSKNTLVMAATARKAGIQVVS